MKPLATITEFVLAKLDGEPIKRRIEIKRALAAVMPTAKQAKELDAMADELEQIEARHRQLVLDFQRRAEG